MRKVEILRKRLTAFTTIFDTGKVEPLLFADSLAFGGGQIIVAVCTVCECSETVNIVTPASTFSRSPGTRRGGWGSVGTRSGVDENTVGSTAVSVKSNSIRAPEK
jgi:hypothetical protein